MKKFLLTGIFCVAGEALFAGGISQEGYQELQTRLGRLERLENLAKLLTKKADPHIAELTLVDNPEILRKQIAAAQRNYDSLMSSNAPAAERAAAQHYLNDLKGLAEIVRVPYLPSR